MMKVLHTKPCILCWGKKEKLMTLVKHQEVWKKDKTVLLYLFLTYKRHLNIKLEESDLENKYKTQQYLLLWRANVLHMIVLLYWRRQWHPTPVLLPGKSHGQRSLEGCSLWGRWGSDITEWLHFPFSRSCIGEGNGNPLQCSCLENPRDGGAWWAAVYWVAQSQTRLKRLSSSSSSSSFNVGISISSNNIQWFNF